MIEARTLVAGAVVGLVAGCAAPPTQPEGGVSLDQVARDIRNGGYILYFRHGHREKWDSVAAFDVHEMATNADGAKESYSRAVCLSAQGAEEARMIGRIFGLAKVPVKTVVASPICRARQTAQLAFGRVDQVSDGLAHTPVTNSRNAGQFAAELQRVLLSVPTGPGEVSVIAAHGNTLENHPGLFTEGAALLKPLPQETGFYVIARDGQKLRLVQRFNNLGDFAARAIDLSVRPR